MHNNHNYNAWEHSLFGLLQCSNIDACFCMHMAIGVYQSKYPTHLIEYIDDNEYRNQTAISSIMSSIVIHLL